MYDERNHHTPQAKGVPMSMTDSTFAAVFEDLSEFAKRTGDLKSDRVVLAFERLILSGRIPEGTRLPSEEEVCTVLGVSRSVVRDSMRTLAARGLLSVRQGIGTEVAAPSDAAFTGALLLLLSRSGLSMSELMNARAALETSLVALATESGTEEDWAELESIYADFADAVEQQDEIRSADTHAAFHNGILKAIHQPALSLILKPLTAITVVSGTATVRLSAPGAWDVHGHRPILDALKARDSDAAVRAMAMHFDVSRRPQAFKEYLRRDVSETYLDHSEH
ncbi:MAG: transcriptional regulator, GntR family [Subtercola sp.]|jgi:DNA-binding FadR family transcriptional regulator|nr:transcriptional regulator, GntR family [Subtercola sp.]